jgi:Domain of unknown function (DUF4307)
VTATPRARPAERYGDRVTAGGRPQRWPWVAVACFTALVVGFAAWSALRGAATDVHSSDIGVRALDPGTAEVTWSVHPPTGRGAVCTIRALNARIDVVGRLDVEVSAEQVRREGDAGTLRVTTRLRTSEPAVGGGVKACLVR